MMELIARGFFGSGTKIQRRGGSAQQRQPSTRRASSTYSLIAYIGHSPSKLEVELGLIRGVDVQVGLGIRRDLVRVSGPTNKG